MKLQSLILRNSLFVFALILAAPASRVAAQSKPGSAPATQAAAIPARLTQAIDETRLVRLNGAIHPLARPEFDMGVVSDSMPAKRILLLLKRSVDQESALAELMIDQQNAASPNYHKWLTPEQFGAKFGPADADIQTVVSWLGSHGFQVAKVSKGKIAIEFSGTARQLREAFHTQIHHFLVNGETHVANVSVPQIPAALAPVVQGLGPLHNFRPKPAHHVAGEFTRSIGSTEAKPVKPEFTTSGGNFAIGPTDFATIYNVLPLWNAATPIDGTGQSIAVIGVSNIHVQDVTDFRTLFGLPTTGASVPVVVIDGDDPGIINDGSETEALLDVEWSGAVAKGAQIHLVIAADEDNGPGFGLFFALFHVLDNNSDPILSLSFGDCEPNEAGNGPGGFWESFWQQASAQGITATIASGDTGSAGCEIQSAAAPNTATTGLQVNGIGSTPFTVAVGGTDFNDVGTQSTYFNATNDPNTLVSAKGYIPESTWNETCTNSFFGLNPEANCNSVFPANKKAVVTVGGGGGKSHCFDTPPAPCATGFPKPAFQNFISAANGMPADGARDVPDVSLFASSGLPSMSFYAMCEADAVTAPSCQKGQAFHFLAVGGTSASTPSFAGIMALVNQKNGRQGNANFVIYKLAQMQYTAATACNSVASPLPAPACTFNDVTTGTIAMPCTKGSLDCITSIPADTIGVLNGFSATAGYDLTTGLGSVNATNLVNNWSTAVNSFIATTTTLNLTVPTGVTVGQAVRVDATVTPASGAAKPTGDLALISNATIGGGAQDRFLLDVNGQVVNGQADLLGGGTYQVSARYAGDATFAPSVSAPVTVTIGKGASTTTALVEVSTGAGTYAVFSTGQGPVTLFLRADISSTGGPIATGTVTFVDTFNGVQTTVASNVPVNTNPEAFTLPGISTFTVGTHSIVANYSGDASFNASSSIPVIFTITGLPTTTTLTTSASTVTVGNPVTLTATVNTTSNSVGPTGMVSFTNGATSLPTSPVTCTTTAGTSTTTAFCRATLTTSALAVGNYSVIASYPGDTTFSASSSSAVAITVSAPATTTTTLTSSASNISSGGSVTLTATVATTSNTVGPTGTVQFNNGTTSLSAAVTCATTAGTPTTTAFCKASLTTTLSFLTPPGIPRQMPPFRMYLIWIVVCMLMIVFLLSLKRLPLAKRVGYAFACLLIFGCAIAGISGCNSYSSNGPAAHTDNITAVYSGDANFATSTSAAVSIYIK